MFVDAESDRGDKRCRTMRAERNFRRVLAWALGCGLLLFFANVALADVRETKHNLIRSQDKSVDEKQVCVFCHTPVVEIGEIPEGQKSASKPLWQKSLASDYVFTIYDDIGRLGLGKPAVGSQSIACLSCHDSIQAFGVGKTSADHPFGVAYRGSRQAHVLRDRSMVSTGSSTPFREAQHLVAMEDFREVSQGVVEGREVFWVSRNGITSRRTRGDLPLYGRDDSEFGAGNGLLTPHIECSSCHDPHASTETFLRVSAAGSQLCLTCHNK